MTINVTQLNNYIHGIVDIDGVLNDLSVCGEITNVKKSYNGWYFTLKDENAAINCFCYANNSEPISGMIAVAEGQLNYFVKTGSMSLFVKRLVSTQNTGDAYRTFVELRDKLAKEGLFDTDRKKKVPSSARRIGVVTSETGAVIHDIENVVHRRQPFSDIMLYPVRVQGDGADVEIAEGIRYFDKSDVEVVIVGRGGGSNEDLSVFNSETVVRAIADCSKPIVSAVGHGIDFTLADFAADKRAVTPSEAAEFVTLDSEREKLRIISDLEMMENSIRSQLMQNMQKVVGDCKSILHGVGRKVDMMGQRIKFSIGNAEHAMIQKVNKAISLTEKAATRLEGSNPMRILQRGYGYVTANMQPICSLEQISVGQDISITLQDGKIGASVTHKEANK